MTHRLSRGRRRLLLAAGALPAAALVRAQAGRPWPEIQAAARGQAVYLNAWGGSERVNAYLQWAAGQLAQRHGVRLQHVKLTDTVEAVQRVRGEKAAGRTRGGTVDALWINGENFLAMKREQLLFGPFAESLPSWRWVDTEGKPTTRIDFSEPVEGLQAPWGMAQFTLYADRRRVAEPPRSMQALLELARAQPGRITYPRPPQFIGTTFLKQALLELHRDRDALYRPATPEALARMAAPLWAWLDQLQPLLWRAGKAHPPSPGAVRQMMADGELLLAMAFNPNEAANEIAARRLPATVHSWQFAGGAIGNTHFLAIPFNANAPEAAQVAIDFLLSPEAQARKADIAVWGDPTVLALDRLPLAERERFATARLPGQVEQPVPVLLEPHGSWVEPLEREWVRRYAS
jgi:putative thiamine transport system substrate-binding protein